MKTPSIKITLVVIVGSILLYLLFPYFLRYVIGYSSFAVPTSNMEPTIITNSSVIINYRAYYFEEPKRGDIAAFNQTNQLSGKESIYLKRIIGIPGDTLKFNSYTFTLNGESAVLTPSYENNYNSEHSSLPIHEIKIMDTTFEVDNYMKYIYIILNEDEYFMVGDNRQNSHDSRMFGPIKREDIIGKFALNF